MTRYVAFLRAINVGGHTVRMAQLRTLFESERLVDVSTYIASGNVIFGSDRAAGALETALEKRLHAALGYEVATMMRTLSQVQDIAAFVEGSGRPPGPGTTVYVGLLKSTPGPARARAVAALSTEVDELAVHGRELYWWCNRSFADATVTPAKLEKALGVPTTVRNFNTIRRIAARYS